MVDGSRGEWKGKKKQRHTCFFRQFFQSNYDMIFGDGRP